MQISGRICWKIWKSIKQISSFKCVVLFCVHFKCWWNSIPSISQLFPAKSVNVSMFFPSLPKFFSIFSHVFPYLPTFFSIFSQVVSPYFLMFSHIFSIYIGFSHGFSHETLHFSWVFFHVFPTFSGDFPTFLVPGAAAARLVGHGGPGGGGGRELVGGTQRQNSRGFLWIFPWF